MNSSCAPAAEFRRARPLLGTLVEITAGGLPPRALERAVQSAFAAIARVHARFSFHEPASDVARLNRDAAHRPVAVHPETWTLLRRALALSRQTAGAFDLTVARRLVTWGLLPAPGARGGRVARGGNWRHIELCPGNRVRFHTPLLVDCGGIAKGHAVDEAVRALRRAGVPAGLVNAGGDLRTFGATPRIVHLRHPGEPGRFLLSPPLRDVALATSALTFSARRWRGRSVGALVNPRTGATCGHGLSVTVFARSAWLADALTKPVAAVPAEAGPWLAARHARAFLLDATGQGAWLTPVPHAA